MNPKACWAPTSIAKVAHTIAFKGLCKLSASDSRPPLELPETPAPTAMCDDGAVSRTAVVMVPVYIPRTEKFHSTPSLCAGLPTSNMLKRSRRRGSPPPPSVQYRLCTAAAHGSGRDLGPLHGPVASQRGDRGLRGIVTELTLNDLGSQRFSLIGSIMKRHASVSSSSLPELPPFASDDRAAEFDNPSPNRWLGRIKPRRSPRLALGQPRAPIAYVTSTPSSSALRC